LMESSRRVINMDCYHHHILLSINIAQSLSPWRRMTTNCENSTTVFPGLRARSRTSCIERSSKGRTLQVPTSFQVYRPTASTVHCCVLRSTNRCGTIRPPIQVVHHDHGHRYHSALAGQISASASGRRMCLFFKLWRSRPLDWTPLGYMIRS
jgi:hypothetical protein